MTNKTNIYKIIIIIILTTTTFIITPPLDHSTLWHVVPIVTQEVTREAIKCHIQIFGPVRPFIEASSTYSSNI